MKFSKSTSAGFLLFFLLCTFEITKVSAQLTEEEIVTTGYRSDGIINIIIDYLPAGWTFKDSNGFFIIQRTDSIMELSENTMNVPFEKKEEKNNRIKKYGKKTVGKIIIRYEDKWDFLKFQEADLNNSSIYNEIRLLPEKLKINKLKDSKLSSKINTIYTPKTESDKINIENYYSERKKLENKIIKTPDNSTQKYSLFFIYENGFIDNTHYIYPEEASNEFFQIKNLFREICGK